jgi:protein SCO1/2
MNKPTRSVEWIVWGGLALVIAGIFVAYLAPQHGSSDADAVAALPVYGTVSDFTLTNQLGQSITLADLRGRSWVADIIFTTCPGPCAKMTRTMKELQTALPAESRVQLVSLTAHPAFDTPEILKKYAERFGVRAENWHFLTGPKKAIYDLAIDGLKLAVEEIPPAERKAVDDLFIHSTRFVLVDQKSRVRAFFDGDTPESIPKILSAVGQLSREKDL